MTDPGNETTGLAAAFAPRVVPVPPRLWVPLAARAGGPPAAVKPVWTAVRRGDPLTDVPPENFTTPLAPADGRIVAVETAVLFDGREVPAVVIETEPRAPSAEAEPPPGEMDGAGAAAPSPDLFGEIGQPERGVWIEALRRAGVWADRWTSPDLLGQLNQSLRRPIDTVLCGVLDTDRGVPLQSILADSFGAELAAGVELIARVAGASRAWVMFDAAAPESFEAGLRSSLEKCGARVVSLRNDYPQANPTLLVHSVLGRRLPPGHLPTEAGVVVLDAAAAVAVGQFVRSRDAMLTVPLAIAEPGRGRVHFVSAAVGTPLGDVLLNLQVAADEYVLYGGAPPRDGRVNSAAVVAASELVTYALAPKPEPLPDACIRCGWCVEACPVHIHPAALLEAVQRDDMDMADDAGLHACIDCGICGYICPSKLPLLGSIRTLQKRWADQIAARR